MKKYGAQAALSRSNIGTCSPVTQNRRFLADRIQTMVEV